MKIYIWGTGCGAGDFLDRWITAEQIEAFVDSNPIADVFLDKQVIRPEKLQVKEDDLILVASRQSSSIARKAAEVGIPENQLIFLKNNWTACDRNTNYEKAEIVLSGKLINELRRNPHMVRDPLWLDNSPIAEQDLENDYVRIRSLEVICKELEKVPGAVAELGVFRGEFARCMNALLPERQLYLFDTFSGFIKAESENIGLGFAEAHRNNNIDQVLQRLPHPEFARFIPGQFPYSVEGLEEHFALVSLDVDLEESTLAGLRWFFPRMNPGAYLLLHDYNSPLLPGVRRAWERFQEEWPEHISTVPLCDINGTLVLCKT